MPDDVMVPSVKGITENAMSYAYGAGAGILYDALSNIVGSSLIGGALAAVGAASFLKPEKAEIVSTFLGLNAGAVSGLGSTLAGVVPFRLNLFGRSGPTDTSDIV